jgi:hypothetical protein
MYSTRPPESAEGSVAEKVRLAREAQQSVNARVRSAVQRARAQASTGRPARAFVGPIPQRPATIGPPCDGPAIAQAGLLNLAWSWQAAGAPIRAIHAYIDVLTRYPDTPAACAAVEDLVALSEKLVAEGQFHTALAIFDHLESLA